jgi:hypothetical protein
MSRPAWLKRAAAILVVVVLVVVYFVVELHSRGGSSMEFAPGEWVSVKAKSAVLLNADGTGEADHLSYIAKGDPTTCTNDSKYSAYTGPIAWRWNDDSTAVVFDLTDAGVTGLALAPKKSGNWAEVAYWACGDTHQTRTYSMTRLELTDL